MSVHRPDIVIRRDLAGRWCGQCLSCMESSVPSFHKPVVDDWRKAHIAEATRRTR